MKREKKSLTMKIDPIQYWKKKRWMNEVKMSLRKENRKKLAEYAERCYEKYTANYKTRRKIEFNSSSVKNFKS